MEKKGERGKVLERKRALIKRERERDGWWVIHRTKLETLKPIAFFVWCGLSV